eukprot:scaffold4898_cov249-Prasinococcus_capsulatus_cf.AAC.1
MGEGMTPPNGKVMGLRGACAVVLLRDTLARSRAHAHHWQGRCRRRCNYVWSAHQRRPQAEVDSHG